MEQLSSKACQSNRKKEKTCTNYLKHHFNVLESTVLAYVVAAGAADDDAGIKDNKKYFLPRWEIKRYDGRTFYDQPISDLIKQYDEVRKVPRGHGNEHTTGSLLNYAYFRDN